MYDVHCHILPGVDDGSLDIEMSKAMLAIAYSEGIRGVIATPHFHSKMDLDVVGQWNEQLMLVQKAALEIDPNFKVFQGAECQYDAGLLPLLAAGAPITLNHSKYILVEFRSQIDFTYLSFGLQQLRLQGYIPILAHVERYVVLKDLSRIQMLRAMGAKMQLNLSSLLGARGFQVKSRVKKMLREDLIDCLGTDAHRSDWRPPEAKRAMKKLVQIVGNERARHLGEELFDNLSS